MDDMKLYDPFLVTRYAMLHNLASTKGWEWTQAFMDIDKLFPMLFHAYKMSKFMKTIKFGVEVPQTTKQTFVMDESDGNNLWSKAIDSEIKSLHEHDTFKVLEDGQPILAGYKRILYHCIYDVKFADRRKCR